MLLTLPATVKIISPVHAVSYSREAVLTKLASRGKMRNPRYDQDHQAELEIAIALRQNPELRSVWKCSSVPQKARWISIWLEK